MSNGNSEPKVATTKRSYKRRKQPDGRKLRHHPEVMKLTGDLVKDYGVEGAKAILKSVRDQKIKITFGK